MSSIGEARSLDIVGFIVAFLSTLLTIYFAMRQKKETEKKADEKFTELSNLLKTAGSKISEMEKDIENKRLKVKELESIRKKLDALVSLREEQVTAVRMELKSIMDKSAQRNRIWTIIIGAVWFVIGLIVRGLLGF